MTDIIAPLPFTLANGTTADASQVMADLNQIRSDVNFQVPIAIASGSFRGALAYSTTPDYVFSGTYEWDIVSYDTSSIWSAATPTRLTVPAGVTKVRLLAQVRCNPTGSGNGTAIVFIQQNGGTVAPIPYNVQLVHLGNLVTFYVVSPVLPCVAGDYFEVFGTISGSSLEVPLPQYNFFAMEVVI